MRFEFENNTLNVFEDTNLIGYIDFEIENDTLDVIHTFVDPIARGKGLAKTMMDEIYSYSLKNNLKIKGTCSYAIKYLENIK